MAEALPLRAHPSASTADLLTWGDRNLLPADGPRARYTLRARGAIYRYLEALPAGPRNEVLLPAWHCPTMVYAIERAGMRARFYGVTPDLRIDEASLRRQLGAHTAVVLVINFFGFPTALGTLADDVRTAGAQLLEDCSHSFLQAHPLRLAGERGDAAVYALWKLVPSGVGALLTINRGGLELPPVVRPVTRRTWLRNAKRLAEEAVENLDDGAFRRGLLALERWRVARGGATVGEVVAPREVTALGDAEDCARRYPVQDEDFDCAVPALQKHILTHARLDDIAFARRANYKTLLAALSGCAEARPLFASLPEQVVPWCLPLRVPERRRYDFRMRERGVPLFTFGETLHPSLFTAGADADVLATACALRDEVVCIGIHQKLDRAALERAARAIIDVLRQGPAPEGR